MLDYTTLYPGVTETLDTLLASGKRMAVLTNKPVRISKAIIEGLVCRNIFFKSTEATALSRRSRIPRASNAPVGIGYRCGGSNDDWR